MDSYWEDLSYLEGLDHEFTQRNSADMYGRILKRISAPTENRGRLPTTDGAERRILDKVSACVHSGSVAFMTVN